MEINAFAASTEMGRLRPSLAATLRASIPVSVVTEDQLLTPSAIPQHRLQLAAMARCTSRIWVMDASAVSTRAELLAPWQVTEKLLTRHPFNPRSTCLCMTCAV